MKTVLTILLIAISMGTRGTPLPPRCERAVIEETVSVSHFSDFRAFQPDQPRRDSDPISVDATLREAEETSDHEDDFGFREPSLDSHTLSLHTSLHPSHPYEHSAVSLTLPIPLRC